jgi:hypothetical protein
VDRKGEPRKALAFLSSTCAEAYEEARRLLEDGSNERATWIAAARALAHATDLANGVTDGTHLRVLELHKLRYRRVFHSVLQRPAAFFYGAKDESISTDEAADFPRHRRERPSPRSRSYPQDRYMRFGVQRSGRLTTRTRWAWISAKKTSRSLAFCFRGSNNIWNTSGSGFRPLENCKRDPPVDNFNLVKS